MKLDVAGTTGTCWVTHFRSERMFVAVRAALAAWDSGTVRESVLAEALRGLARGER